MTESDVEVAIIGAGAAGLAAAWQLSQRGVSSLIFEKSRGTTGRAATRRRHGHRFDHGANFLRLDDDRVADLLRHRLPAGELVEIPGDVHTVDAAGRVRPGDPTHNSVPKWTYRQGISSLGKLLLAASEHAEIRRETRIIRFARDGDRWRVEDHQGRWHGGWESLLLTLPLPQAADLVRASGGNPGLAARLDVATYHHQFTFVLGYPDSPAPTRDFHALVNPDGLHPVAWLSFEEDKPGHVADGSSVVIAQMSPDWSREHFDEPPEKLIGEVVPQVSKLLSREPTEPAWWDVQRWRYAHPVPGTVPDGLADFETEGLYFAGDGLAGKGRVTLALKSGLDAADRISGEPGCG